MLCLSIFPFMLMGESLLSDFSADYFERTQRIINNKHTRKGISF